MSHYFSILSFLAAISFTYAIPTTLSERGLKTWTYAHPETGDTYTHFAPNWPTCGNDKTLSGEGPISLSTTKTVNVRPDCDNVINAICNVAVAQAKLGGSYYGLGYTFGTCEGHMLFSQVTPITYEACVSDFQTIPNTCMLMDDPTVKNYASVGKQFGVKNIYHNPSYGSDSVWNAATDWNRLPGYMMGPPGVFGDVDGRDISDFNADGSLSDKFN